MKTKKIKWKSMKGASRANEAYHSISIHFFFIIKCGRTEKRIIYILTRFGCSAIECIEARHIIVVLLVGVSSPFYL